MSGGEGRLSLSEAVKAGIKIAIVVSLAATVVFVLMAGAHFTGLREFESVGGEPGISALIAMAAIYGSYFAAGALGGVAWYFLQAIAHRYIGKMLVGFVLGAIAYGMVGLISAVMFSTVGINLMEYRSVAEAWETLPLMTLIAASGMAIIGPPIWIWNNPPADTEP